MKTFTTSFAAIIFALFILTSCGAEEKDTDTNETAQDIDVTKLEEPCDFADAALKVEMAMNALQGEVKDGEGPTPEQEKRANALMKLKTEIQKAVSSSKVDLDDMQDCPSMKKLENL
jgi:hypothetical protein